MISRLSPGPNRYGNLHCVAAELNALAISGYIYSLVSTKVIIHRINISMCACLRPPRVVELFVIHSRMNFIYVHLRINAIGSK